MAGESVFISHKAERQKEISDKLLKGLHKAVLLVEREAKMRANFTRGYQTGRLRSSITGRVEGLTGFIEVVGTNVEYASFVEHGTSNPAYPAQPFLYPALEANRGKILELLKG